MRKISVNQLTTMSWSFDEDVVSYRSRGIKRIGINRDKAQDFGIEKSLELLRDSGMTASSYGSLTISNDLSGPSLSEQIYLAHQEVEDAAVLGADRLIFHTGGQGGHLRKNRFCVATKVLDQVLPVAEEHGVVLALEPMAVNESTGKCHSHCLADCVELIDKYDSQFLGLNLDLFQVENTFLDLSPEWFAKRVCLVQLSDFAIRGERKVRTSMGSGGLELTAFDQLVKRAGYAGVFEYEMFGESFDYVNYHQTLSAVAESLHSATKVPSVELESIKA